MNPRLRHFLSPPSFKGWLKSIGRSIILAYLLLVVCALFANKLLFHPPGLRHKLPAQATLRATDGNGITALYLPNPQAAYVVLLGYGNGEDVRAALATRLGHPVGVSVIDRMLVRPGWHHC
jgi:hypothetical protein